MKSTPVRKMSKEELRQYRHEYYLRHREKRLEKAREYYQDHKKEKLIKAKNRYRTKCGLKPLEEK